MTRTGLLACDQEHGGPVDAQAIQQSSCEKARRIPVDPVDFGKMEVDRRFHGCVEDAESGEQFAESSQAEGADMGRVVVEIGSDRGDGGDPVGTLGNDNAPGLQNPVEFLRRPVRRLQVFQYVETDHAIEESVPVSLEMLDIPDVEADIFRQAGCREGMNVHAMKHQIGPQPMNEPAVVPRSASGVEDPSSCREGCKDFAETTEIHERTYRFESEREEEFPTSPTSRSLP